MKKVKKKVFSFRSYSEILYLHRLHVFCLLKCQGDLSSLSISTGTPAVHTVLKLLHLPLKLFVGLTLNIKSWYKYYLSQFFLNSVKRILTDLFCLGFFETRSLSRPDCSETYHAYLPLPPTCPCYQVLGLKQAPPLPSLTSLLFIVTRVYVFP